MISPDRRREAVDQVIEALQVSERRACRVIGQPRATQRYPIKNSEEEEMLREEIVSLASLYGRYGYRNSEQSDQSYSNVALETRNRTICTDYDYTTFGSGDHSIPCRTSVWPVIRRG